VTRWGKVDDHQTVSRPERSQDERIVGRAVLARTEINRHRAKGHSSRSNLEDRCRTAAGQSLVRAAALRAGEVSSRRCCYRRAASARASAAGRWKGTRLELAMAVEIPFHAQAPNETRLKNKQAQGYVGVPDVFARLHAAMASKMTRDKGANAQRAAYCHQSIASAERVTVKDRPPTT